MSKDENKCDNAQNESAIPKNKNVSNENVAIPESGVKILSRGDLLGAINCLFPELQLKSSHMKSKENFSLFSYSPQELTRIFESGRKYRTRVVKNVKNSIATHSLRTESSRINLKRNINTLGNSSTSTSTTWKSKAQTNKNICQAKLSKRYETVQFESHYTDFLTKFLESQFTDRYTDFKNIECLIQEIHNLFKEISKTDRIGPFNPNLPVLNISECDKIVRKSNSSKDVLKKKSSTSTKHMRNKKVSQIATKTLKPQNEALGKEKRFKTKLKKRRNLGSFPEPIIGNKRRLDDDFEDEIGKNIARNIEGLLSDDTFTPRYESKHKSDMFMIFQKTLNSDQLEREAIEQYQSMDDTADMNFNLLESQARQQYEN